MKTIQPSIRLSNVYGTTKSITLENYPDEAWDWISGNPDSEDEDVEDLYKVVPWLFRGVTHIVNSLSQVPIALVRGENDIAYFDEWDSKKSPLIYLPNPRRLIRQIAASVVLEGRAYLFRDEASTIRATKKLVFWNPLSVKLDKQKTKEFRKLHFERTVDGKKEPYTDDEVMYFWPEDGYTEVGPPVTSPAKAALKAAGVLHNIDMYTEAYFKRGAIRAMILAIQGNPPPEEYEKLESWWAKMTSGVKQAFKVFAMNTEKVTPTLIGDGLEGLQDSELTKEKREDISTALGVPQSILFSTNAAGLGGGGVTAEDTTRYYQSTIVPLAKFIVDVFNNQQLEGGYRLEVRDAEMDVFQEDENARATSLASIVSALQDPEAFEIGAEILGFEIADDTLVKLKALMIEKEKRRQEMAEQTKEQNAPKIQAPGGGRGGGEVERESTTYTNEKKAVEPEPVTLTKSRYQQDIERFRRVALKHIGKPIEFTSDAIPDEVIDEIRGKLEGCNTKDEVKGVFTEYDEAERPFLFAPDYSELISKIENAVKALQDDEA